MLLTGEYADGTDRRTDARPLHYAFCRRGQRNNYDQSYDFIGSRKILRRLMSCHLLLFSLCNFIQGNRR